MATAGDHSINHNGRHAYYPILLRLLAAGLQTTPSAEGIVAIQTAEPRRDVRVIHYDDSSGWTNYHSQSYSYDADLDYLTGTTYSVSYTGSESWSYDAAGNRIGTGYAYDNLNRMWSSPNPGGGTYGYDNDVLGNRTWRNYGTTGVQRYVWDEVNRLKSLCGTAEGAKYEYRADGMRVRKITGLTIEWIDDDSEESKEESSGYYDEHMDTDLPTLRYFYDGQMPMEEDWTYKENSVNVRDYTQYGLGARGMDYIRKVHHTSGATVVFPIYDGHGNMVYTLKRDGTDDYLLGNKRIYGAWGDLRYDGNPGDGPNTQYCANLGHKLDGESGLTYMRARYYERWTGRFISEDPAMDDVNWYAYCGNDPVNFLDVSGRTSFWEGLFMVAGGIAGGYIGKWLGHLAWTFQYYYQVKMSSIYGASDRFDRAMKIHDGFWAGMMRNLAAGVLAFALGWLVMLEGGSKLKVGWRVTITFAIGLAMGFIGAFYSDMLLALILDE